MLDLFAHSCDEVREADGGADGDVETLRESKHGDLHRFVGEFEGSFGQPFCFGPEEEGNGLVSWNLFERD